MLEIINVRTEVLSYEGESRITKIQILILIVRAVLICIFKHFR